jgi:MGT family glycosyltransferase
VSDQLTVLFWPESAYGPTNNCIGIGNVLRQRGHRVVFAAESSWAGRLAPLGFEEELVDLAEPAPEGPEESEQDAGAFWKEYIREIKGEFQRPTIDQLDTFIRPTFQALIDGAKYCEPRLREIIERVKPDIVVEDNVVCFPALMTAGVPYVRIVSCNPLEMRGPDIAPVFSGYPADDRTGWEEFRAEFVRSHRPMWEDFNAWCQEQGAPPLHDMEFIHTSEHLNLYIYPEAVDYTDRRPLDPTWQRIPSSVRGTEERIALPSMIADRPEGSALIYLSLGSLGSADVALMERLVDSLSRTPHRYIVSTGPCHQDYELAENMWGAEFLPQTTILPEVDLVITHGGNNTTVESLHFGKPMIVLPLFWDQYDNAQRMDETGFGIRLDTYTFTDEQMHRAIERLLDDEAAAARRAALAAELQSHDGVARAAERIEQVVRPG